MSRYCFRLYVAGTSPNSVQAMHNLHALCRDKLPDEHEIEVVDVLKTPLRALTDGVLVTPTLVKLSPPPLKRITGNLSHRELVMINLGLPVA